MDEQTGFNPKRRLCPDGACTGIIGRDGRCGECGGAATGQLAGGADAAAGASGANMWDALDASENDGTANAGASDTPAAVWNDNGDARMGAGASTDPSGQGGFDPRRRLCVDGACVGVLGPDGACTVCGRAG